MLTPWVGREAEDFADGLTGRPPEDAELAELVAFAGIVEHAATIQPAPEFQATLREALMAEAADVLVREPAVAARKPAKAPARRRRLAAAVTSVVVAGGGVSLAASSASALPGEMLYPVKRSLESAQVVFHRSDSGRATYDLQRASERLSEATALVGRDAPSAEIVAATLDDFTSLTTQGVDRAFDQTPADQEVLAEVAEFAESSAADLSAIADLVPADAASSHAAAITVVSSLKGRLDVLCETCHDVSYDALDDLRNSVEQAARETPAPDVTDDESPADPPEAETSSGSGSSGGSTPTQRDTSNSPPDPSPGQPSAPQPVLPNPDLPLPETPSTGGLLDPVTELLLGDPENPSLLGGLLGRR